MCLLAERLMRGIWKISVKTTEGPCYVQIYGQSGIQEYTQFTTDTHADDGTQQPFTNAGLTLASFTFRQHYAFLQNKISQLVFLFCYLDFDYCGGQIFLSKIFSYLGLCGCNFADFFS